MTKRHLQIVIGCLWLLDGLLQLQPKMFSGALVSRVLLPAANGQPAFVSGPIHWAASVFLVNPIAFNSAIVLVQLCIGMLILVAKTARLGLWLSVFWGLVVWIIGEGYGGIFSGQFNLLTGAPGAALIYVLLALAALPHGKNKDPSYGLAILWSLIWLAGGVFVLSQWRSVSQLRGLAVANSHLSVYWLADIGKHLTVYLGGLVRNNKLSSVSMSMNPSQSITAKASGGGYWLVILFGMAEILIAMAVFLNKYLRSVVISLAIVILLVFWVVGQDAGGYFTGYMTDLNTAPLLMLTGVVLLTSKNIYTRLGSGLTKIKEILV